MPKARLHFEGDNTGIEKEARLYSLTQEVEDKLDSISSIETTLQGEIDDLQDQINQVASRGRYLTTWDCTTGLPDTNPTTDPYTYRPGDYYIVGTVGGTNYRPHGSEYHVGVASQTLETQAVSANDLYIYDGTQWTLQRTGASVYAVWGSITGNLQAQTDLQNALNDKANRTDVLEKTNTTSYTPTTDYHPATKKYADDNDTYIGTSAPTDNVVEGRLWYDTTADVLKVYNGSQWVPTGKTYTAGSHIEISNADVISTKGLQEELTAGDNITIEDVCTTESDMKGPAPTGYHVPSKDEWGALCGILTSTFGMASNATTMGTYLKMPMAGCRKYSSSSVNAQGANGYYWSSTAYGADSAYSLLFSSVALNPQNGYDRARGSSVRCFKDSPTVPDASWTTLYDGSSVATGAGVYHNSSLGLISVSGDGTTWYTIQDKNLGATTVYNSGDTLSEANCGTYFQWGNNYGFAWTGSVTTSSTKVDASSYGPGNYYSSGTFITGSFDRSSVQNDNLRGGVTQGTRQDCDLIISATDTTYSASDFDIKDLTDSTGLRTTWNSKQDALTAGSHINISSNVISTTGLQDKLTAGDNIQINPLIESDMKGPCPSGYHVPLDTEWQAIYNIRTALGGGSTDGANFGIALKLPLAGYRSDSSSVVFFQGTYGSYRSSSRRSEYSAYFLRNSSTAINPYSYNNRASGSSIRCFKNSPVVPTSSWTKLYGTSIEVGGIFWSSTDGLISLSSDGQTWITITDKNLGATTVWNSGDTLSEANCGKFYQRGNNYGFPRTGSVTTSSTQVDASVYGPGNYYSSNTFILNTGRWDTTDNGNLWGGVTQGTWQDGDKISAIIPENDIIPVYYYLGDFNNDITFNIIEAGVYRLYVRAYHGATVDKTLTLTVDGVAVGALTSNLIEHLNASINFTASAGSTAVLSVSSKTNFTIQEVYIEKVNIQSGYLTAIVN